MPLMLSLDALSALPAGVGVPAYNVRGVGIGIVHLGIGAFHRGQQAVYTDEALALTGGDWGICGVSLRSAGVRDRLRLQDGLYTSVERSPEGVRRQVIGSVREVLFLGDESAAVQARLAAPETRIVSLTVTEKGYCHDPATGHLDLTHPDIVRDLETPARPVSAVGLLVAALGARRLSHGKPFTVVCCDNLPHNGALLRGLVATLAQAQDPALARWIADHACFPSTMVDRIVPATTDADITENDAALGVHDAAPVVSEPFRQWVIEDAFVAERPAWERVGVQFVADVTPFETMKLRLLNGSHSTLAYLGFLAGYAFIWQASSDPQLALLIERQMADEIVPTLAAPLGINLAGYCTQLMSRFRNPALPHRTQQIAMDGSQKLPQRFLGTVRDRIASGASYAHLALAIAGWIRYASGTDEQGRPIAVSDPMAETFAAIVRTAGNDPSRIAAAFLDLAAVFGDLVAHAAFRAAVTRNVVALFRNGAQRTLASHLASTTAHATNPAHAAS